MAWGMLPCLGSAMCACTWHFFYNSPDLEVSSSGGYMFAAGGSLVLIGRQRELWLCSCMLASQARGVVPAAELSTLTPPAPLLTIPAPALAGAHLLPPRSSWWPFRQG